MNKKIDMLNSFSIYIKDSDIQNRIKQISNEINSDTNKNILFVCVLEGAARFMFDLIKQIKFDYEIGFIKIESYSKMKRGEIKLKLDISNDRVINKDVIIIEDIVDSGETIKFLTNHFSLMNPKSIKVASLLVKQNSKELCDYYGYIIENKFVVGYGMDIDNLFRNLNDIYIKDD